VEAAALISFYLCLQNKTKTFTLTKYTHTQHHTDNNKFI